MNNTYKTNKTDWRRLVRSTLFVALLLGGNVTASAQDATQNGYVFIRSGSRFLDSPTNGTDEQTTPTGTTTFSPQTCFWLGTSGNTFSNTLGYYLYDTGGNDYEFRVSKTNSSTCNINNTGTKIQVGTHWLGEWGPNNNNRTAYWELRSSENNGYACVNAATKNTYNAISTDPTISGPSEITALGTSAATFSRTGDAAYRVAYFNYRFQNADHLFAADNSTTLAAVPTNHSFSYAWSLSGIGSEYAEINTSTGVVNYKKSTSGNVNATVTLTATSTTDAGVVLTASQTLTFKPLINPTGLSVTAAMTVYAGQTSTISYTFDPSPCYENLIFSSNNTSVADVNASGVVTGVSTGTATITVTAYKLDGTTDADLTKTVTVTVKDKVATPVIAFTPDPSDNTQATAEITCATPGTTIYYTVNGGAETAYSNPFPVNEYEVVNAYAVKTSNPGSLWDDSDPTTNTYVSCSTGAPTISYVQSGTTATVTITAEAGTTIYYTTTGSDPIVGSSANGLAPLTVNNIGNCTFKAIAKNGTCSPSAVVSKVIILSGVSGGVVTLYDREDHNWSYYSDEPDSDYPDALRSPDPRNVTITYRGGSVNNASAVAVSATEPENEFVYYKTIEKKAWGQSEGRWLTGDYAYKVIPNPFSKRPRANGSTGTNGFYGFAGWKIISGGEYIAGHNNNDELDLEEKINFVNLPAGNDGNAAVVFEATWTAASVVTTTNDISGNLTGMDGTTYETNFIVYTDNGTHTVSGLTKGATISNNYPNGSAAGTATISSFTTSSAPAKLEYIKIGNGTTPVHPTSPSVNSSTDAGTGTFTAQAGELIVGRGCTGTVRKITSGDGGGQYKFRIESGKYNFMYAMESAHTHSAANPNYGRIVLGCDYDRAADDGISGNGTGDNRNLRIVNFCSLDGGGAAGSNDSELMDITVKSGYYGFSANYALNNNTSGAVDGYGLGIGGNTDNFSGEFITTGPTGATITYTYAKPETNTAPYQWEKLLSFYVGPTRGAGKGGVNRMLVEGGEFNSINGGGTRPGADNAATDPIIGFYFRMKGGWVKGAVYGTASISDSRGSRSLVFTGGEVNGWVAGGCNGTDFSAGSGINHGTCYIYAGGNTEFRSHDGQGTYNNAYGLVFNVPGGQIFGAGRGLAPTGDQVQYCGSTTTAYVVVADESLVEQNVYGGGYNGVSQYSYVYILGGTVGKKVFGGTARAITTDVDWRCRNTDIRMYGGTVKGGVYGGHDETGTQFGNATVNITGGTVGTSSIDPTNSELGHVFGSGFGQQTSVGGNVTVSIGTTGSSHIDSPLIFGNVYGGGHAAPYTSTSKTFWVKGFNGLVKGSIFGGGKGRTAVVTGNTDVQLQGYIKVESNVYGGGDAAEVTGNTNVTIQN
jgi:hypothetical protein